MESVINHDGAFSASSTKNHIPRRRLTALAEYGLLSRRDCYALPISESRFDPALKERLKEKLTVAPGSLKPNVCFVGYTMAENGVDSL